MGANLQVDQAQISRFMSALFRYADEGTFISLRTFDQSDRSIPPIVIRSVKVNGDATKMVAAATADAQRSADHAKPAVFAPPIATFKTAESAKSADLANGLCISLELDDHPYAGRARMETLLGPATLVVASGSQWEDKSTGEVQLKLHLHWRLNEPTRDEAGHAKLRSSRAHAALLAKADPTGVPLVHPYRWPGSWNTKATPRLATIIEEDVDAEIDLDDAAERLEEAVVAAFGKVHADEPISGDPQAPVALIASAVAAIPNDGTIVHYNEWIRLGYAVCNATGGAGYVIWDDWSRKSHKYDAGETEAAWKRIVAAINGTSAPRTIGAGTIFYQAAQAGWTRPDHESDEPPPDIDDPGYHAALAADAARPDAQSRGSLAATITEFNSRYAVVNENGKAVIYEPVDDLVLNRRFYSRITFEDLKKLYANRYVKIGKSFRPAAEVWLQHPDRRQFIGGVVCDPTGKRVPPGALNLWQGFAVQPRPGSWQRMKDHVLRVICAGNRKHFDYLMGWMARLVQRPAEQGEVAVVLRGGEGTGKGTLARALRHILGQHGLAISNSKHLTGNFNGHLRDTVFLFADEAFFAGDRAHVGVLKSLITEPYLTIEAKYANAVQMPNYLHVMMASNEDWVVPASLDARRFFVLEVPSSKANDHAYFGAIWQEMENGGYEAMLHDLLKYDLTFFNVRAVPKTDGLMTQKKLSLPTAEAWWLDVLHRGYVFKSRLGLASHFSEWRDEASTDLLYESYSSFATERRERHPMSREALGRFAKEIIGAKPKRLHNADVGEHITDVENLYGSTTRKAQPHRKLRPWGYSLGSLVDARAAFARTTGLSVAWEGDAGNGP